MKFKDSFSLAFRTVTSNKLRSGLTITIIAFGIMALVGIITAIKAMNQKFSESFSTLGANAFTIRFKERNMSFGNDRSKELAVSKKGKAEKKSNLNKAITQQEAEYFVRHFSYPGTTTGISVFGKRDNVVSFKENKTNPNVILLGGDEQYLDLNGYRLIAGRNMSLSEVNTLQNVCILGYDVAKKFFSDAPHKSINQYVNINNIPYKVVGVLESRGATFGFSRDNMIIISYGNIEKNFSGNNISYTIVVKVKDIQQLSNAMGEAETLFRSVRKTSTKEESNFVLERSDSAVERAMNVMRYIRWAAIVIGMITLLGAAIGLMNIMLVSVAERTKEVGLIKAIGGKKATIQTQFLMEAIIISVLGALLGIALGIVVGNIFSIVLKTGFVVPWNWIMYGILICSAVGLAAGIYPAVKAGKLNPIDALRYE